MFGLKSLYKYSLEDNYFETELLHLMSGKEYTYVFEMEIPEDKNDEDDFIDLEFEYKDIKGENNDIIKIGIDKMDETLKEKAKEEYLRVAVFENIKDAVNLREENKKKEAEEKLSNIKGWLNLNYKGKENYMNDVDESLEIIKNDILYEKQGLAMISSNVREKEMKRGGNNMIYQNSIQRNMVASLNNIHGCI